MSTGIVISTGTFRPYSSPGFQCGELSSARTASADNLLSGDCRTRMPVSRPVVPITNETTTRGGKGGQPMTIRTFRTCSFTHSRNVRMSPSRNRGGVSQCMRTSESRNTTIRAAGCFSAGCAAAESAATGCFAAVGFCPKAAAGAVSRTQAPIRPRNVMAWPGTRRAVRRRSTAAASGRPCRNGSPIRAFW